MARWAVGEQHAASRLVYPDEAAPADGSSHAVDGNGGTEAGTAGAPPTEGEPADGVADSEVRSAERALHAALEATMRHLRACEAEASPSYTFTLLPQLGRLVQRLGVEHAAVSAHVRAIDAAAEALWKRCCAQGLDIAMVVTADHGHLAVERPQCVELPPSLLDCLEYANIGLPSAGRCAIFHCRAGRHTDFQGRWHAHPRLRRSFALLSVEDAVHEKLFGPEPLLPLVRARLGDFVAVALTAETLVAPREMRERVREVQGAHGSLLPDEMRIPCVCLTHDAAASRAKRKLDSAAAEREPSGSSKRAAVIVVDPGRGVQERMLAIRRTRFHML